MQYKRSSNNNKISNRKTTVYTNEEVENDAIKHDMKKAYFTSTTSHQQNRLLYHTLPSSKLKDFYYINRHSKRLCGETLK